MEQDYVKKNGIGVVARHDDVEEIKIIKLLEIKLLGLEEITRYSTYIKGKLIDGRGVRPAVTILCYSIWGEPGDKVSFCGRTWTILLREEDDAVLLCDNYVDVQEQESAGMEQFLEEWIMEQSTQYGFKVRLNIKDKLLKSEIEKFAAEFDQLSYDADTYSYLDAYSDSKRKFAAREIEMLLEDNNTQSLVEWLELVSKGEYSEGYVPLGRKLITQLGELNQRIADYKSVNLRTVKRKEKKRENF